MDGSDGLVLEIGFHAEHKDESANDAVLAVLEASEKSWRRELGKETESGRFLGNDTWRRVSDVWLEPDVDDPELGFEIASRLVDYLTVLEPIRQVGKRTR